MRILKLVFLLIVIFIFSLANPAFGQKAASDSLTQIANDSTTTFHSPNFVDKYGFGLSAGSTSTYRTNVTKAPLIVIDGIPYPDRGQQLDYTTADINDIAQMARIPIRSIKNIEFQSYSSEYFYLGSLAKNGVVLITTKEPTDKNISVDYSYRSSIKKQQKGYELLSGNDYTLMIKQALYNPNENIRAATNFPELNYDMEYEDYYNYNKNTDWQDEMLQNGILNEHFLSVGGHYKHLNYGIDFNYLKEEGTLKYNDDQNFNLKGYLSYTPIPKIKVQVSVLYQNHEENQSITYDDENLYTIAVQKMSNMAVYDHDSENIKSSDYFIPVNDFQNLSNPVALADFTNNQLKNGWVNPTFQINYTPIKNLEYGLFLSYENERQQQAVTAKNANLLPDDILGDYSSTSIDVTEEHQLLSNHLKYTQPIGRKIQTFAGVNYLIEKRENSNNSTFTPVNYLFSEQNYKTWSGEIGISGFDRYFFQANWTTEKMDEFNYPINQYLTGKWIVSNETFLKNASWLDHLSINANYSTVHNPYFNYFYTEDYETIKDANLGLTASLFKKLHIGFSNFNRNQQNEKSNDELDGIYVYNISNTSSNYVFGATQNTQVNGWEIHANIDAIKTQNVKINVFANLYRLTKSLNTSSYPSESFGYENGTFMTNINKNKTYGSIYGFKYQGVYQYSNYIAGSQESAPVARDENGNVTTDLDGNPQAMYFAKFDDGSQYRFQGGDAIYADLNYDGSIDEEDISLIGDARPELNGTFGASLQFKNLWLGTFFNFRYGNDIVNEAYMNLTNMYYSYNQSEEVVNRWRKEGDISNNPRALYQYGYNWLGSNRYVQDGSFIRLKAITLRYDFPETLTDKLHLQHCSVYVSGKNLFTFTKYKGADVDISLNQPWYSYGYDSNYQGITKEFTFGLNVGI